MLTLCTCTCHLILLTGSGLGAAVFKMHSGMRRSRGLLLFFLLAASVALSRAFVSGGLRALPRTQVAIVARKPTASPLMQQEQRSALFFRGGYQSVKVGSVAPADKAGDAGKNVQANGKVSGESRLKLIGSYSAFMDTFA